MKSSILIAVSTGSLYPRPTLESIEHLIALDIQEIELTLQPNELFLTFERNFSMPSLPDLLTLVHAGQLHVGSVHAPTISAERCYNLWARLQYLAYSVEVCRLLGGRVVVIHPFHLFRTHEDALDYLTGDGISLQSALLPGINDILDQARSAKITLALENIQDWQDEVFFNNPKNMSRFLKEMDHPFLGFTFDLMHAQVSGFLDAFINSLAAYIVNIHASDLFPPTRRVSIGRGVIDWNPLVSRLQSLPNLCQITVELSNPEPGELTQSVELLSNLIS